MYTCIDKIQKVLENSFYTGLNLKAIQFVIYFSNISCFFLHCVVLFES